MSNEELVKSLRTEIQTYLKNTVADLQQEIAEMQERINGEIERHRGELEKSFHDLLLKGSAASVDDNFAHVISEHLQMAFEDGSKEAADAARAEAAKLPRSEGNAQSTNYAATRDAINEISHQTSQADILKSLVKHSSNFVPRGAFFIVKSDHLVGWRMFGSEISGGDEKVREVFLSVNGNTVLGEAIRQNSVQHAAQGEFVEDAQFLRRLDFGAPAQVTAIPLVVRGRGVAVLYADAGENGSTVQTEALESLVRVAGLTVELLASAKSSAPKSQSAPQSVSKAPTAVESSSKEFSFASPQPNSNFNAVPTQSGFDIQQTEIPKTKAYEDTYNEDKSNGSSVNRSQTAHENFDKPAQEFSLDPSSNTARTNERIDAPVDSLENFSSQSLDKSATAQTQNPSENSFSFETTMPGYAAATPVSAEPQSSEVQTQATPRRFGERNPELPINVPEDERRLHNDARRFARLLVSEIKLYNEQKVKEGRQAKDLYGRLREAIVRSREMYDKRVAPPVAALFDYFHYELVNTLAEGEEKKLGDDYPGGTI